MNFKHLDSIDPSTCINGKMNRINRLTGNIFRRHLKDFDVTSSQLTLLFVLYKRGGLTQKELTDILFMEKSSVNRNLRRLFENGYATKKSFPIIEITDDGKMLLEKVVPSWQAAMKEIRESLQQDGESAVDTILSKLKTTHS
ncbi:MarR family winged helix-turn-helix transcriptional regulator [Ekhidna sp.]|uniref:MarR family winged helix-turn-helix transcriptional regulator n=1 Tax=Ekhidna sp. TaxID=2608089 RepID=UPI0032989340